MNTDVIGQDEKERQERHKQGCTCCEQEGDLVQPAELMPVLCAVLESDDGADADSESQVKSVEQKFSVEQDGDGGNAVFPGKAQENKDINKKVIMAVDSSVTISEGPG